MSKSSGLICKKCFGDFQQERVVDLGKAGHFSIIVWRCPCGRFVEEHLGGL